MGENLNMQEDAPPRKVPPKTPANVEGGADRAQESLADALKVSFRILTIIMIFVVVAFLFTGFKSIEAHQVGIIKVFGRVVGTAEEGLAYTYPFPVGQIELVDTSERTLTVEDAWVYESAADKLKPLHMRRAPAKGLQPGYGGALLTGDRNLLHIKMICKYAIQGSEGAKACRQNIEDLEETIHSQVCKAAILAAARRTADGIQRRDKAEFSQAIRKEAQRRLNQLTSVDGRAYEAVRITALNLTSTWPLAALPAYLNAQKAISEQAELRNQAIADAREILNAAAGANHEILVGEVEEFSAAGRSSSPIESTQGQYNLIGQYVKETDEESSKQLLAQVEEVLMGPSIGGQASAVIADARAYRTQVVQGAESRAKRFDELLSEYEKNPQFMLERHWAEVRDAILSSTTVEKIYVTPGSGKMIYRISPDPEIRKQIRREILKREKEAQGPGSGTP